MTQPASIAPAVAFDQMKTNELARPAFAILANDAGFLGCHTLREQVLYAKQFLAAEQFSLFPSPTQRFPAFSA